jgi:glycosyltransferase involved in cell wall biosynthesis
MKVLYIGHYKDGTGWGNAALNNILALNVAGVDVVPRPITYELEDKVNNEVIEKLEQKDPTNCDIVIQHTLPSNYCYDGRFKKNIGVLCAESSNFIQTDWARNCNMMDEIWVPNEVTRKICLASGVTVPVKLAKYSLDFEQYKPTGKVAVQEMRDNFVFGFVGEFIERKNVQALIRAFHMTFDARENVKLFIKTSKKTVSQVQEYCSHIKKGLKLPKSFSEEIIICGSVPQKDYVDIISQIDCFVMPSRGESFCIPSLEVLAMGIPSIWTEGIGMDQVIGLPVPSRDVPCFGAVETLPDIDTSASTWKEIDIIKLSESMRKMYDTLIVPEIKEDVANQCRAAASKYSHEVVGLEMKGLLNDS